MPHEGLLTQPDLLDQPSILDLLDIEQVEENLYRSCVVFERPFQLYGGQVAAQALCAAGRTVPPGRQPHSLHGYFLRAGDTTLPTVFGVERDRDGRSFSARRVVAIQDGKVIFNMSASFAEPRPGGGQDDQDVGQVPELPAMDSLHSILHPIATSLEMRAAQEWLPDGPGPTRFLSRCTVPLPDDDLVHSCVLTYLSDISSGLIPLEKDGTATGASLDHALWFHRQARMDDWVLVDLVPHTVAAGRGWYTGAVYGADGVRVASIAQEALFSRKA